MRTQENIKVRLAELLEKQRRAEVAEAMLREGYSKSEVAKLVGAKRIVDSVSAELAPPTGRRGWLRAYHFYPDLALKALNLAARGDYESANIILNSLIKRTLSVRGWQRAVKRYEHLLQSSKC